MAQSHSNQDRDLRHWVLDCPNRVLDCPHQSYSNQVDLPVHLVDWDDCHLDQAAHRQHLLVALADHPLHLDSKGVRPKKPENLGDDSSKAFPLTRHLASVVNHRPYLRRRHLPVDHRRRRQLHLFHHHHHLLLHDQVWPKEVQSMPFAIQRLPSTLRKNAS